MKTPAFTYHTVQKPVSEFTQAAVCLRMFRPAEKKTKTTQNKPGLGWTFPPTHILISPVDCEFWFYHTELTAFEHDEKPLTLHSKTKQNKECQVPHFEGRHFT